MIKSKTLIIFILGFLYLSCSNDPIKARKELHNLGIKFDTKVFKKHRKCLKQNRNQFVEKIYRKKYRWICFFEQVFFEVSQIYVVEAELNMSLESLYRIQMRARRFRDSNWFPKMK